MQMQSFLEMIATHKSTQADSTINRINPIPKYYLVWQDVKRFIEQRHGVRFEEIHEIPAKFIREAIAFIRGSDPRTIRKWLKVFTEQKLIKWITPELVEVMG